MYCTNCGKKLTGTETFCPSCGARQAPPTPPEPAADPQPQQPPAAPDAQPPTGSRPSHPAPDRRGKRWLLLGLAGVVLLLLAINTVLANRTLSLPDPAAFFGLTWETMPYGGSYDYSYDETAPSAMDADTALAAMTAYTAQLNAQGIDALVTQKDTQNRIEIAVDLGAASLLDRSRQKVWLDYYLPEQRFFLSLPYGQSLQTIDFTPITAYAWTAPDLAQAEPPASQAAAAPEPAPDPEPAPVQPPAQTEAAVPDFQAFCGNTLHVHEITEYSDYTEYVYFWKYNGKAMQEYLSLLQDTYHFQLRAKYTISSIDSYRYAFDYTGAGSPGTYDEDGMETDADGEDIALYLWDLAGEVHICLADGFTYQDTGDRTTRKITPYDSGKTSAGSSNSSSVPAARSSPDVLDCLTCGGSGDCPKCNGYGTMRVYGGGGDSYEATCSRCYGNRKCPACGGSGKR